MSSMIPWQGIAFGDLLGRIYRINVSIVSLTPPAQGAAGFFTFTFTLTGVRVGDVIQLQPPSALENTLRFKGADVTANDTVTVGMEATAAVTGIARNWGVEWYDLTPPP